MKKISFLLVAIASILLFVSCDTEIENSYPYGRNFDGIIIQIDTSSKIFFIFYEDTINMRTFKETYSINYDDALVCRKDLLLQRSIVIDRTNP